MNSSAILDILLRSKTLILITTIALISCERDAVDFEGLDTTYPVMEYPQDNPVDSSVAALGERLFFDPILSADSTISCASCHKPDFAFADNKDITPGVNGLLSKRNSPSLWNIGFAPYFMREGGVPTLEMQVLVPLQEVSEMNHNIVDAVERLAANASYVQHFDRVYGEVPSAYLLVRALANFERTLISFDAPFDRYIQGESSALSKSAQRGGELFYGKAQCATCHGTTLFTDFSFSNNGTAIKDSTDVGRERHTQDPTHRYTFKVPSLRHVKSTAPYMHDGSMATLAKVIEQYNNGGTDHSFVDSRIQPLNLSAAEQEQLLAFLESL